MRRWVLVFSGVLVLILGLLFAILNLGVLQSTLEKQASQAVGGPVKLGHVSLVPMWPLALLVGPTEIDHPVFSLKWKALRVDLRNFLPPFHVRLKIDEPILVAKEVAAKPGVPPMAAANSPMSPGPNGGPPPLHLALVVRGGDLTYGKFRVRDVETDFEQERLLQSPVKIQLKALVEGLMVPLPIEIESRDLTLTPEKVSSTNLNFSVAGLAFALQGESLLKTDVHRWQARIDAPDLSKLPKFPVPATDWAGAVQANVLMEKKGPGAAWAAQGDLRADKVFAQLNLSRPPLMIKGPFHFDLQTKFNFAADALSIPQLQAAGDFTQTEIIYENMLNKTAGVPLSFSSQIDGDQNQIQIRDLQFNFWKVNLKASGHIATAAPFAANLKMNVPSFSLDGAEKILVMFAKQPVQGEVGLIANFEGPLTDPKKSKVLVESLKLKNIFADVTYEKPDVAKISGPVRANVDARFQVAQGAVKQADAKGRINLSDMTLHAKPLHKEAKQLLIVDFQVRNTGDDFDLQNLSLDSFAGKLKIAGKVTGLFDPKVQLKGDVQGLNLSELRMVLPDFRDKIPKGQVSGTFTLNGQRAASKPWSDWPLAVGGDIRVTLPEYVLPPSPPVEPGAKSETPPSQAADVPTGPFLPPGDLTNRLSLKITADIASVKKDTLVIKGVHSAGTISGGRYRGGAKIDQIFSGNLQVTNLDIPLLSVRPTLQGSVRWKDLVIQDALEFAKPSSKDMATGRMAGNSDFMTYMPADKEFKRGLKARGAINLEPVTLNSVKIGEIINDVIKKVPMLKLEPVKVEPLQGSINSDFDYKNETLQIEKLTAIDQDQSELQMKGKVVVPTMQGDFVGTFLWAKSKIQGCLLEGNSDAKGRMVIPVAIKGDLMHPGFSMISDTIGKLSGRTLDCEKKKLVEKLTRDGGKQLENEVKKHLKGLFGN